MTFWDFADKHPAVTLLALVFLCFMVETVATNAAAAIIARRRP